MITNILELPDCGFFDLGWVEVLNPWGNVLDCALAQRIPRTNEFVFVSLDIPAGQLAASVRFVFPDGSVVPVDVTLPDVFGPCSLELPDLTLRMQ